MPIAIVASTSAPVRLSMSCSFRQTSCLLAVLWRLRYKLRVAGRGRTVAAARLEVTHETIRAWEFRSAPLISADLRVRRCGRAGRSWYIDETYVKVGGRWCYLYRAIDRDGQLIDSMLSEHRDRSAARRFLRGQRYRGDARCASRQTTTGRTRRPSVGSSVGTRSTVAIDI